MTQIVIVYGLDRATIPPTPPSHPPPSLPSATAAKPVGTSHCRLSVKLFFFVRLTYEFFWVVSVCFSLELSISLKGRL